MSDRQFSLTGKRVFVAGHRGMAGSAIVRRLASEDCEILTISRSELDLRHQDETERWMKANRPDVVFLAAATVGGIIANSTRPAEFLYDNLAIETNVIKAAMNLGVKKLLFLGASCLYPRLAAQPMVEEALLTGPLEPTNEWYAIAKIAGIKLCQAFRQQYGCDFISAMPTNMYGIGDRYDLTQGHVVASLIMKFHAAKLEGLKEVELWGTGKPEREFLFSEDFGDACIYLIKNYSSDVPINVGTGSGITIRELAEQIGRVVGLKARLTFDASKPDGSPRKILDVSKLSALGWRATTGLADGLRLTYEWYNQNHESILS
jgi:GDP-L-fucose synthase